MVTKKVPPIKVGTLNLAAFRRNFGSGLFSDTEFFLGDDGTVAVDVFLHQVVEKTTTFTYQFLQCALCRIVLMIQLEVLSQVRNTERE